MMTSLYRPFRYFIYSIFRWFTDNVLSLVFYYFSGSRKKLPPLKNTILLKPAWRLAEQIRKKELKSVDVVQAYILRMKEVQPYINAIVDERYLEALEEARKADERVASGNESEEQLKAAVPFLGVPFTAKEAIPVKGLSCTLGLVSRSEKKAAEDAVVVKLMKEAGAIAVVVTNIPQYAMWFESSNKVYGITSNPYDTRRTCGGSSGGEGALIAAGGSVVGLGNDIGGSIRIPSSFNGIFGHNPSPGIVSNIDYENPEDVFKNYIRTGPMCRYATDLLPAMKILAENNPNLRLGQNVDFRSLKIYYSYDNGGHPLTTQVVPEIKQGIRKVVHFFRDTYGVPAHNVHIKELKHSMEIWFQKLAEEDQPPFTLFIAESSGPMNIYTEFVKWCFRLSDHTLPALLYSVYDKTVPGKDSWERKKYLQEFEDLQRNFNDILDDNSIFLYPTHPQPAPHHHETVSKFANGCYTAIFNILPFPSTQVPMGFCKHLPFGIQIIGGRNQDNLTMSVAVELEKAFGGWISPCPVLS